MQSPVKSHVAIKGNPDTPLAAYVIMTNNS